MNKYKHSINVTGKYENLVKLGKELEKLGYRSSLHSMNSGKGAIAINGSSRFPNDGNGTYAIYRATCARKFDFTLMHYNRAHVDAILGIAAIQNSNENEFAVGELLWTVGAGGWGYSPENNHCIAQVLEIGPRRERNDVYTTQEIVFKTLNPRKRDEYTDRASVPNNTKERRIFKKLTPSEIINYYTHQVGITGYTVGPDSYNWTAPPGRLDPDKLLKLVPNKPNMKKIIAYKTKFAFPGIPVGTPLIPIIEADQETVKHNTCEGLEYIFRTVSLHNNELFEPVYEEEEKRIELINIGSNKLAVSVGKEDAAVGLYGKVKIAQIQDLYTNIMNITLEHIKVNTRGYSVTFDLGAQFIRIGCTGDNNRFSFNDLEEILQAADRLKKQ